MCIRDRFCEVEILPSKEGGIVFCREGVLIPAHPDYVLDTHNRVVLARDGVRVSGVEHLLSCMGILGINSVLVNVMGEEIPAFDGSGWYFWRALKRVGTVVVGKVLPPSFQRVEGRGFLYEPGEGFVIEYHITLRGRNYSFVRNVTPIIYEREIVRARTFGTMRGWQCLRGIGLARGANLCNSVLITRDGFVPTLRYPDEPVRHKVLDLIGDLMLIGCVPQGRFVIKGGGHTLHLEMVKALTGRCYAKTI